MFPLAPDSRPARPTWRAAVRRAADLVVAFATLDDPALDERAELEDVPADQLADPHPHRSPLRPAPRAGRPGMVPARPTSCSAPVSDRRRRSDHLTTSPNAR